MIKLLFPMLLITACAGGRKFPPDEAKKTPLTQDQISKSLDGLAPDVISISKMHWGCCGDLCRGTPQNVKRDVKSPKYIYCYCKDGRTFHVTRVFGKR